MNFKKITKKNFFKWYNVINDFSKLYVHQVEIRF